MPLILASASPRRSELLRNAGIAFTVDPADVAEQPRPSEMPLDYAQRLASEKAWAVLARHPGDIVLGADTVVVIDEHLLEKPADRAAAARMLRLLSGRTHQVITGVCLLAEVRHGCAEIGFFGVLARCKSLQLNRSEERRVG